MLYRKAYEILKEWKAQEPRKALCIIGARQIGKTTLIRRFGKENYNNFVEINFIEDPDAIRIFDGKLDADTITTNITAFTRKQMDPGNTLVLLDEIQECPNARTAIKFLVEDGRFDYIESGSLLGVKHREIRSYPVGYEQIFRMYPMDFEEFILANGVQQSTIDYLKQCCNTYSEISDPVHNTMIRLFYSYIVVGGMPQVVNTYVDSHDIARVIMNQNDILELYRLDISRYAEGSDKIKIRTIFDSIPSQLNEKNRRFILSDIDEKGRQNRYGNSFRWLDDAGVALPCLNISEPQIPLSLNEKHSLFKLFMNDTGLLCASCMGNIQFELLKGNLGINMGSILENVIAQQIKSQGFKLNYF
ncbi:MAG: ATP-binding protein, partial [Saccharofermentanales bacterium]